MDWRKHLLWIDGWGGLAVGVAVLLACEWLVVWYGLPLRLVVFLGTANLVYGCYSLTLASSRVRSMALIKLLVVANLGWALLCLTLAIRWAGVASCFGLAHLVLEGVYVGALGCLEWRWREHLRRR